MYYLKTQRYRPAPGVPAEPGLISAIIPVYERKLPTLSGALRTALGQRDAAIEIIVVGNGIRESRLEAALNGIRPLPRLALLERNLGAAHARNMGAQAARGEVLWFLDSDVTGCDPDAARAALEILGSDEAIAAVGGILYDDPAGRVFAAGRLFPGDDAAPDAASRLYDDDFVNTACLFVRRSAFERVEGFADYIEYPFDDVDFGFKLRAAGFRCVGTRRCAGVHPVHANHATVFHEFLTFTNLLSHVAVSHTPRSFASVVRRKRRIGWRFSPPQSPATALERVRAGFARFAGAAMAVPYVAWHAPHLAALRRERWTILRGEPRPERVRAQEAA
ncbi:MAG TPA: glycosyltransferase [bacterium]